MSAASLATPTPTGRSFALRVATFNDLLFTGQASYVGVPGVWGHLGVLKGHAPLLTVLAPGQLRIRPVAGTTQRIDVAGGVAEVAPWGVTVLADYVGADAATAAERMAEASRQAAVHVPFALRPVGADAVRAELDAELLRFFATALRERRR